MQFFISVLAFVSTIVTGLPTDTAADGRGATIHTSQNFQGDSTAIPGNAYCADLNNIFGNFDGKVRSMVVAKGFKCQFHANYGCPADGWKYEFGSKDTALGVGTLPEWLDRKIHAVYCTQL